MIKIKLFTLCSILLLIGCQLPAQVFIDWNSQWSYFKGLSEPSQPNTLWKEPGFNDSGWQRGNAPFRFGDGTGGTLLSDMQGRYATFYIRKDFQVPDAGQIDELLVGIDYDDGFVLWINGELFLQNNAPQNLSFNQFATNNHESGEYENFTLSKNSLNLANGTNAIAVQGFNVSNTSSDFYLDLRVEGIVKLPETERVYINKQSGFFQNPFTVTVSGTAAGDTLKYTLDGSDPRFSQTALAGLSPLNVTIDPESVLGGRGRTGGVVLRASKFKTGFAPSKPVTHNYVFLSRVIAQSHPGGKWPATNINGQWIDLTMDTRITSNFNYRDQMEAALLDIPSVFVTTDPDNLFDPGTGIYVNAKYHGRNWERPANIELLNPDGSAGFNIDAGLRIRGGWSRHPDFAKHAFRVFFRSEYGEGKLRFPLFGNEGADVFDKIDFRTSQNYSWSKGGSEGKHNTMNRDVFSRETQGAMGQPYTRSRYYHLYINGLYWGIYQSQERAEADFSETYFGGSKDDYDVIKVDIGENWNLYEIEATDGNTNAWEEIWNMCVKGFASNEDYFMLMGYNAAGKADTTMNVWVDIDNLIDYMLIIFYGGNFDAPVSKFSNNYNPNNFFAIYNRTRKREGFKFMVHDAEHTLLTDPVGPGIGLYENRVNIGNIGSGRMNVTSFMKFHPQWLHHRLTQNEEYRMRFADRVYRHFFNNGVFDPDSCIARFRHTADQLDLAIIAESARWGDMGISSPRTKISDWIPAVNRVVNDYMPYRTEIVLNQLLNENLYLQLHPPVFKQNQVLLTKQRMDIDLSIEFQIENPNTQGSIYYTLDGSDPRAVGGGLSPIAVAAGHSTLIEAVPGNHIKARVLNGTSWSALAEIYFQDAALFDHFKITELHYHPADHGEIPGTELEFLEFKNTGTTSLDLSGLSFTEGISFNFPDGMSLSPGAFTVIASNTDAFTGFYGFAPDFQYSGNLSNSGEKIVLQTAMNDIIMSFTYSDRSPWPQEADGDGPSLVAAEVNPTGDPGSYEYWTLSGMANGSPFADDNASALIGFQQMVMHQAPLIFNLDEVFSGKSEHSLIYSVTGNAPGRIGATVNGSLLTVTALNRGDALIQVTASDGVNAPLATSFRVLAYPAAHVSGSGDYAFESWPLTEPEYSYPDNMIFLQTNANDPELEHPLHFPYYIEHNDYHSNDEGVIGFPYACTGRTRINALGDEGISFINTGRQRDLGGAVLALDTRGMSNLQLEWTAGTLLRNERNYAIRLQYRTSLQHPFADLLVNGEIQEYTANADGHVRNFNTISLPQELLNREYLQLLWRYYHIPGATGPRAQLRLDDIRVGTIVGVYELQPPQVQVYAAGRNIRINIQDSERANMRVFSVTGQELMSRPLSHSGLHTIQTQLPVGVYVVRVDGQAGSVSRKVIITDW